jgi:hypothetical protein
VYLDGLGQFEGRITAVKKDVIAMAFTCSRQKRQNLADQLTIEINRHLLDPDATAKRFNAILTAPGSKQQKSRVLR